MGGGAWPFLVGGVICLVNSDNERDLRLLNSAARLAIGTNGYVLTSNGTTASWAASTGGVTSFSAGTTGLTPSTGTTGAITLAGTLGVANGGTGATTLTGYVKGSGTSALTASSTIPNTDISGLGTMSVQSATSVAITGGTINGTSVGATTPSTGAFTSVSANLTITGSLSAGAYSYGSLSYSDTGIFASYNTNTNSYAQIILANGSAGTAASTDFIVGNNNTTATTYFGDFGMNSSAFSGTGSLNAPNAVFLASTSADLAIGTNTANAIHFVVNGGSTDAMTINSSGAISVGTWNGTAIGAAYGGTGVANNAASTLTISGAYATTLTVSGSAKDPKITLSSVPDMPQDEILAQLLFNTSTSKLSPLQLAEIAAALAQLSGATSSFDPLGSIRSTLGLDRLSVGSNSSGNPTLEAGSYLARGVYVGAKQSASGGGSQATVQIDLAKGLKLETTAGSGSSSATGSTSSADAASVGLTYQFEY